MHQKGELLVATPGKGETLWGSGGVVVTCAALIVLQKPASAV